MDDLEQLEALLTELLESLESALESGEEIPDEVLGQVAEEMDTLNNRIIELRELREIDAGLPEQVNQPPIDEPPSRGPAPTPTAQLLWILAGQQEQAFISYLREFPTPDGRLLLENPTELSRVVNFLNEMMPRGTPPTVDGIQHSDLNSSNIWGSKYDERTGKLTVRFQGGREYEYDNVPANIYRAFQKGNATARTTGRNQYGVWWRGKNPSMGAALNQYIKAGGFPYRRTR